MPGGGSREPATPRGSDSDLRHAAGLRERTRRRSRTRDTACAPGPARTRSPRWRGGRRRRGDGRPRSSDAPGRRRRREGRVQGHRACRLLRPCGCDTRTPSVNGRCQHRPRVTDCERAVASRRHAPAPYSTIASARARGGPRALARDRRDSLHDRPVRDTASLGAGGGDTSAAPNRGRFAISHAESSGWAERPPCSRGTSGASPIRIGARCYSGSANSPNQRTVSMLGLAARTFDATLGLITSAGVDVWPLEEADVALARQLHQQYPALQARDLCHLASCRRRGVREIKTFDQAFAAVSSNPIEERETGLAASTLPECSYATPDRAECQQHAGRPAEGLRAP